MRRSLSFAWLILEREQILMIVAHHGAKHGASPSGPSAPANATAGRSCCTSEDAQESFV